MKLKMLMDFPVCNLPVDFYDRENDAHDIHRLGRNECIDVCVSDGKSYPIGDLTLSQFIILLRLFLVLTGNAED